MSTNKFLSATTTGDLTDGTINIFGASLGAFNLDPSKPLRTDSLSRLVSTFLPISDITNLQTTLDGLGDLFTRTAPNLFLKNFGDKMAIDTYRSQDGITDITFENTINATGDIKTDIISEVTTNAGITADGVLLRDSNVTATEVSANIIN